MYFDLAIKFNQFLEKLEEPNRIFLILIIYIGLPILCIALYKLDNAIQKRGEEKIWKIKKTKKI